MYIFVVWASYGYPSIYHTKGIRKRPRNKLESLISYRVSSMQPRFRVKFCPNENIIPLIT